MDLQINHDSICVNETVFSSSVEQGVEIDYMLPDYCKSIFKILKASIEPKISSIRISGDKLNIDGMATARIIYLSEEDSSICAVTQKQPFSKTIDINCEYDSPEIISSVKTDYANCRVINSKHLDMRGALTISIEIINPKCTQAVTDASGGGLQLRKEAITVSDENRFASKQFTVMQSIDAPYGKPEFGSVINCSASCESGESKIVSNKVITKGEVSLHILYSPKSEEASALPEIMDVTIPISQIVDVDGIDDEYNCVINFDVCSAEIAESEEQNSIDVMLLINVSCTGYKNKQVNIVTDAYSTKFAHSSEISRIKANCFIGGVSDMFIVKSALEMNTDDAEKIIDSMAQIKNCAVLCSDGEITVNGTLDISVLSIGKDSIPAVFEKSVPFEQKIKAPEATDAAKAKITPQPVSCSYNISSPDSLEIRCEIKLSGCLISSADYSMINNIALDEESPKENACPAALTLYFADSSERVWDIAKKYNTNVQTVIDENELDSDVIAQKTMLLIPITE